MAVAIGYICCSTANTSGDHWNRIAGWNRGNRCSRYMEFETGNKVCVAAGFIYFWNQHWGKLFKCPKLERIL